MKKLTGCGLLLALAILIGSAHFAATQNAGMPMAMATNTLLVLLSACRGRHFGVISQELQN